MENLLNRHEVMARLNISEPTFYRYIKRGIIPAGIKLGDRATRWKAEDIENYIAERENNTKLESPHLMLISQTTIDGDQEQYEEFPATGTYSELLDHMKNLFMDSSELDSITIDFVHPEEYNSSEETIEEQTK